MILSLLRVWHKISDGHAAKIQSQRGIACRGVDYRNNDSEIGLIQKKYSPLTPTK